MSDSGHLSNEKLNQYLDGVLSSRAQARVEEHLARCEACTERMSEIAGVFSALDSLPEVPLTTDLAPGIVENLRSRSLLANRPSGRSTWHLGLALAAEVVGAMALLGLARPEAVPWLAPMAMPGFTTAVGSVLEEAAVFLSAALATPDPLGLEALLFRVSVPGVPWASVSSLMTLLAGSTLVWLLGNGLLLRRGRLSPDRRNS